MHKYVTPFFNCYCLLLLLLLLMLWLVDTVTVIVFVSSLMSFASIVASLLQKESYPLLSLLLP